MKQLDTAKRIVNSKSNLLLRFVPLALMLLIHSAAMAQMSPEQYDRASNSERQYSSPLREDVLRKVKAGEKVQLDLYVMSQCPFGVLGQRSMANLVHEFGDKIEVKLNYIATEEKSNGVATFNSMHGQSEVEENIRQLVIARDHPEKLWSYIEERAKNFQNENWQTAALAAGVDVKELIAATASPEATELLRENIKVAQKMNIAASPTLYINNAQYNGPIFDEAMLSDGQLFQRKRPAVTDMAMLITHPFSPFPEAAAPPYSPLPTPPPPIPPVCTTGSDPFTGGNYVVCASNSTSAWISSVGSGTYHSLYICNSLGYSSVGSIGGTCGNVCGYCTGATSCSSPGTAVFDGGGSAGSDSHGPMLCCTVQWQCLGLIANTAPTFNGGSPQSLNVCKNSGANSINSKLTVTDPDASQTETWTVTSSPSHGTITTGTTASSGSSSITPTGWSYTPTSGYSGTDAFTIQVSDGSATASTTINVTVNALPVFTLTAGGPTSFCSGGSVVLYAGGTTSTLASPSATSTTSRCDCPAGYAAVGYDSRHGSWMDQFKLRCKSLSNGVVSGTDVSTCTDGISGGGTADGPYFFGGNTIMVGAALNTGGGYISAIQGYGQTAAYIAGIGSNSSSPTVGSLMSSGGSSLGTVYAPDGNVITGLVTDNNWFSSSVAFNYTPVWAFNTGGILWSNSATTSNITVTSSGTYTATITDNNGCTYTPTGITVTVYPTPAAITGNTTLSTTIKTTLSDAVSGGTWTSGATGVATVNSTSGVVTGVTVGTAPITYSTGGSCEVYTTVNVLAPQAAMSFDGTDDHISLPSGLTSSYSNFTFEAWVYPTSNSAWQRVMDFGSGTTVNMFLTSSYNGAGTPRFAITTSGTGGEQQLTSSTTMPLNTWSHIAVTINGSTNTGTLYINGNVVATNAAMTLNPAALGSLTNNWLGRSQYADPYFAGNEDEVRIWNVVRTQSQIQADMNCDVPQNSNLKAYYRFNEGTPSGTNTGFINAYDYSGNNNCGLLNNFAKTGSSSNYVTGAVGTCNAISITTPAAITGNAPVCVGSSVTLANANTGGLWSSSSSATASVNSTTGVVTGVAAGSATITYTLNCGIATAVVTVNAVPAAMTLGGSGSTVFSYSGAIQNYTVPAGVTSITLAAKGAQGGSQTISGFIGGQGAIMQGNFTVTPGHVLGILVGQQPAAATYIGGGGGGTFVWDITAGNTLLIAAGGGGGAGAYSSNGINAVTTNNGTDGGGGVTYGGGGVSGNGGTALSGSLPGYGSGGAGWLSNGGPGYNNVSCSNAVGGVTALAGGFGGTLGGTPGYVGNGGYGGGGGAQGYCGWAGGGGGGGYSGGGGGHFTFSAASAGGGGGSYNVGSSQLNSVGNTGNGQVTISYTLPTGTVCVGANTTVTNTTSGGTWSSSNSNVSLTGTATSTVTVTGVSGGTSTLTYTLPTGCYSTATITVNSLPTVTMTATPAVTCAGLPSTVRASVTNLVGYWQFEEGTGSTTADASGNSLNGTLTGSPTWATSGALVPSPGNALTFTSGYVNVPDNTIYSTLQNSLTIEAWIYQTDNINNTILDRANYNFLFQIGSNSHTGLGFYNPTDGWTYGLGTVPTNTWSHVAMTWDNTTKTVNFYLNGALMSSHLRTNPLAFNSGPLNIGRQEPNSCQCNIFTGTMDEVRLYNKVKSQAEIVATMNEKLNYTYTWAPALTLSASTGASVTATPTVTTTYTVTATNLGGCTSNSSLQLTVNPLPVVTFTTQPGATACASTGLVYATQTGMTNYVWTYSGTAGVDYNVLSGGTVTSNTVTVQFFTPGPHTVSVNYTDANGCTATSATPSTPTTIQMWPTITSATPLIGYPASSVAIVGTNFNTTTTNNIVYFGATRATVTSATTTSLNVTVPVGATFMPITVENNACALTAASKPFLQNYNNSAFIANTVNLDPKVDFSAGTGTTGITLADIDGDGKSDIAVTNASSFDISVFLNTSTSGTITAGSFASPVSFGGVGNVRHMTSGDVDGDGKLDLIVGSSGGAVSVFRNTSTTGSVSFASRVDITTGVNTWNVAVGDLDGDGRPEIAVANLSSNTTAVYRNLCTPGTISFASAVSYATGNFPQSVKIGDIDGDNKPELVVSNNNDATASVFRNTCAPGSISFAAKVDFALNTGSAYLTLADIDGDGKLDISSVNFNANNVSVLRNTSSLGTPAFAAKVDFAVGTNPRGISVGDIDGDGKPDLLVSNSLSSVSVLRNTATSGSITSSSFAANVEFPVLGQGTFVAAGDVDGDGKADVITTSFSGNGISVLRNNPLQAITGTPTAICAGGTTITTTTYADATPNGTWSSSNTSIATVGSATGVITGVAAGVATITYAGTANSGPALGNYTVRNVTVNPIPVPTFLVSPASSLCVGNTGTYTTQNSQYSYTWSVPGTLGVDYSVVSGSLGSTSSTVTIKWLTPGVKTVTVNYTNVYGCHNGTAASSTVTVNPNPTPITGTSTICVGQTTTLGSTPSGGTWTSSNTSVATINPSTGFVNGLSAGTAIMSYTLSTGCYAARAVIVNPLPTITPTNTSPACVGGLVNLSAGTSTVGATTYAWSGPSGFSSALANPGISGITLGAAGTYTLTAIVTATGCTSTSVTTVTVNPVPTTAPTNTSPVCIGGTVNFNAVASAVGTMTISWTGPAGFTSASATPSRSSVTTAHAGSYVVTVSTPGSGCIASATTVVTINAIPAAAPTNSSPVCAGTLVTLSANPVAGTGVTGYSWSGPAGFTSTVANPTLTPTVSGTYSLTVTSGSGSGCTSTTIYTTAVTINPMPAAIATGGSGTATFTYTGSSQTFTVPAGVTSISVDARGATGGTSYWVAQPGGNGGRVECTLAVTPGQVLSINIGGAGANALPSVSVSGGYNGGGSGLPGYSLYSGAGGGGATDIRMGAFGLADRVVVASGGGGGGDDGSGAFGGAGGGLIGATAPSPFCFGEGGGGASGFSGGSGGTYFCNPVWVLGIAGTFGSGGNAGTAAGGGGGGYYGGGGGCWGGGGGGSSYTDVSLATGVAHTSGFNNSGNGLVIISYTLPSGAICVGNTTTLSTTPSGGTWTSSTPSMATVGASTGVVTGMSAGTPTITYTLPAGCYVTTIVTVNPLPASVTGTASVCVGSSTALSNTSTGGSWSSSNTSIATVGTTGMVTGVAAGNATITYTLPTGCFSVRNVTVNGIPTPISGTLSACVGSATPLASTPTGGVWTSSNSAIASVGSTTGIVSGVAAGYATVTYTTGAGCYITAPVTINPNPAAIAGTLAVCAGSTTNLSSATTGGTWISGSPSVASVGASTGVVTGNIPGTAVITYLMATGCSASVTVTVNIMPTAIAPVPAICVGSNTTLSSTPGGGTWSSSSTALATVTSGGLVTGVSAGIPVITYAIGSCYVTRAVTVNPNPAATTGILVVCMGSSTSLSNATAGGTWSSSAPGVASVSSTGLVTGLTAGTANIVYTLGTGCATSVTVTVNTTPSPITGTMVYCAGNTGTLTATPAGGTWTSSNTAMATVSASGVINAISAGTPTITYGFGTGCMRTATITVNPNPAAISGTATVCVGGTTTLSNTTAGGVWTSGTLSVATIGSSTGIVSGAIAGTTTITYTLPTGCFTTVVVTVNGLPAVTPWSGTVCLGLTTTVAATPAGGTWSSSNTGVATVGASSGIANGVAAGTATLTYSLGTGCSTTTPITVNPLPVIATWSRAICVSGTTTLNATPTGGTWSSSTPSMATIGSLNGVISGVAAGTLTVTYTLPTGCIATNTVTVNGLPSGITGITPLCVGTGATLGSTPTGGVWSSNNTAVATVGSSSGVVAAISAGTSVMTYTLSTGCYTTAIQTVNPLPAAITGITNVCTGSTTALFNASTGGAWTSSNTAFATVNSTTGVVTGVAAGTLTITYTLPTGCLITTPFTVNPTPTAFTGTRTVCVGLTTTLASTPTGGTWSSSNIAEATVVSASGVVTGVSAGIPVITYTMPTGCYNTAAVTVNPLPAAIAGASAVCTGTSTTLSSTTTGGTWSSSSTTTATVNATSGIVTGVNAGTVTITYTLPTGCIATKAMTVNANPTAITGTLSVCTGLTTTVNSTPAGGIWSSSNVAEATVGSTTGIVTGVTAGMPTLTYTLATGCYTTAVFTVNQTPPASTGSNQVCIGLTTTLANTLAGGTWSSSNPTFATVTASTGIVSGLAAGSLNITYTMPTGCFVVTPVTVNANPSALSGPGTLCPGTSITLTSSPTGGVWTSSNTTIAVVGSTTGVVTGVAGGLVTINYTLATGCLASRVITVNPAPNLSSFALPSATSPCIGGSSSVTLNSTSIGAGTYTITYNLTGANTSSGNTATVSISATSGSFTIPSSLLTLTGAQNVIITSVTNSFGCSTSLSTGNTASFNVNVLPTVFTVGGGGGYCAGGTGVGITLSGSTVGVNYQLFNGSTPVGAALAGTSTALTFGTFTTAGTYTVVATNATTGCVNNMAGSATVTVNPLPTTFTITGGGSYCAGGTGVLVGLGGSQSGVNYQLYNGSSTVGVPVAGTGSAISFGLQTAAGTYTIVATNATTSCTSTMSGSTTVVINPVPAPFTGATVLCVGATTTLATTPAGGTWTSTNPAVANIGSASGFATGMSGGSVTITYTLPTGCFNTTGMTINPLPSPITGTVNVCVGSTTTLSSTTTGGAWTSSNSAIASVGTAAGIVTGVSAGTAVITYTIGTGCFVTTPVTVNPVPNPISGTSSICIGLSTTLSTSSTGGTWSSSATGVATVGSLTGVVSGAGAGTAIIRYTFPTGCNAAFPITVNPIPASITGTMNVCVGATRTVSSSTTGGTWISSNTSLATVGSTTGVVTGVAAGAVTITYIMPTGCLTTTAFTVNPAPAAISGPASVCLGSTIALTNTTSGGTWSSASTSIATVTSTGIVTGAGVGTTNITYTLPAGCFVTQSVTVNSNPATITGTFTACVGTSTTLSNTTTGGTWTSSNPTVASVGGATGIVTGLASGTVTITYTLATGCFATTVVTINPNPAAITGPTNVCTGLTITLADATTGGTWSSSNPAQGSVNATSGVVTGISVGTPIISYTLSTGCFATYPVVINQSPDPISGPSFVCVGSTAALSNTYGGGTWSSSNLTLATVGPTTGVVNGLAVGTPVITYTLPPGCIATTVISVNPVPSAIGGTLAVCVGSATPLTNTVGGGTWTSSNPGVASVGGSTGMVSGVAAGTAAITYTLPGGCFTVATVTVNPLPAAISGVNNVCVGSSITLTNTSAGGTWTSSIPTMATIGATTGVVNGLAAGTLNITYTLPTGCFITMPFTVNPLPATITGTAVVCVNATTNLFDATSGGVWSSSNTAIATIGSASGVVTGVAAGNATIAYTLPTGCFVTRVVTVNALPLPFTVTGGGGFCTGGAGVAVGLSGSNTGFSYQLYNGSTPAGTPVAGTGASISFGLISTAGTYTVIATNTVTGCFVTMTGSVTVFGIALPTAYTVTGGGTYCAGGSGFAVGLAGSQTGVNYQLYNGATMMGAPVAGTGSAISFGTQTLAGTYTVVATSSAGCVSGMTGSVNIIVNPLPTVFSVTGGGAYCVGGSGVRIGLSGSTSGVSYQLFRGTTLVATLSGTGATLDFGFMTTAGTYTVTAINSTTGCASSMSGSAVIVISSLPTATYTVGGGGSFCAGGSGVAVTLSGSDAGVTYQLQVSGAPVGSPLSGTSTSLNFGLQTVGGTYSIVGTSPTTGCSATMTGSVNVVVNPLPTPFSVTGGGSYCAGGSAPTVGLSGSQSGVTYQLFRDGVALTPTVAGTGSSISFGTQATAGVYTVVGTSSAGCVNTMTGSTVVAINPLPSAFSVTGGGGYCTGGSGVVIGLSGSQSGVNYQLSNGSGPVGAPVAGTGAAISFGTQTVGSTYTVTATNAATGCTAAMTGSAVVTVNSLPTAFTVNGGGAYCTGGAGATVGLSNSQTGVSYQLYLGTTPMGGAVTGTGSAISFGPQSTTGTYTVVATNTTTGCVNNMTGSVTVSVTGLPSVYLVTGGGSYCTGGVGVAIGLSGSQVGVNYQLYNGTTTVGSALAGTGGVLSFGLATAAGSYTVVASAATSCTNNMLGSVTVIVNPLPAAYTVTGGGSFCLGGSGVNVGLSSSATGVSYQLYRGTALVGMPVAGTGMALNFGLMTVAGTYTVVATNVTTGCTSAMTGSASVSVSPLPTAYTVSGGGTYCSGGSGVAVGLSSSQTGIKYQLYMGTTAVGGLVTGTGSAITFGLQTAAGSYTVMATDTVSFCTRNMTGSATITVNPLPTLYSVTGGGTFCAGASGVTIGLTGSQTGISYRLYNGTTAVGSPLSGTGLALSFGTFTTAGTYTIVATNGATSCTRNMSGSATIVVNPLPVAVAITGGGSYCSGGTGVSIGLVGSAVGVNYQLYRGTVAVGSPVAGIGGALTFGTFTTTGTYTAVAVDAATGCTRNMTGSVSVSVSSLPTAYSVSGGGSYCAGGAGVSVGLSGSSTGVSYQLYIGTTPVGSAVSGTGSAISFGLQTVAGTYTVVATNTASFCSRNMTGSATVVVNPLPAVFTVTGGGSYCVGSTGLSIGLSGSSTGVSYQLRNGTAVVGAPVTGTGSPITFGVFTAPGTYTVIATGTGSCTSAMTGSATITVNFLPTAYTVTGGGSFCAGGSGVAVGLSNSTSGISYQLYRGTTAVGSPVVGTGSAISFGLQTTAGSYTVVATNSTTGCSNSMTGSVTVSSATPPTVYTVSGGGAYCSGPGYNIYLSGSQTGVSYRLYFGSTAVGSPISGTGTILNFGLHTSIGTYTVVATNVTSGCTSTMSGSAVITAGSSPTAYMVTGGGSFCAGGTGYAVGLSGSQSGVNYQLYRGTTLVGSPVAGTGGALSFGTMTIAGGYTVVATNPTTGCVRSMTGSATITVNALPTAYTVTGGGSYCSGGTGVTIGLSSSAGGVSYKLYRSTTLAATVSGTGASISFGLQTTAGTYTVVAMNSSTGCTSSMSGSATVTVNTTPVVTGSIYTVAPASTITLVGTPSGGTWTSSSTSVATIGSSTGVVSGVALGTTTISYTMSSGCRGTHTVSVTPTGHRGADQGGSAMAVSGAGSDIRIVPNPNHGAFSIKGTLGKPEDTDVALEITNMLGQVIYTGKIVAKNGELDQLIELKGSIANGMYLLNVKYDSETKVFHVIVEK